MGPPRDDVSPDEASQLALLREAATRTLDALSIMRAVRDPAGELIDFEFVFSNEAAGSITGIDAATAPGRRLSETFPDQANWLLTLWGSAIRSTEPILEEIEIGQPGGLSRWLRQQIVPLADAVAITSHDITARKRAEQELRQRASHDPLTGLPNRVVAEERITRLAGTTPLLVMFADLDRFKVVNDTLGHAAGDELLIQAARRLRSCLRSNDLVARFGGDEFVICIDDAESIGDYETVVHKLLESMRYPFHVAGRNVTITASIGVAFGEAGDDALDLIRDADAAAYVSKSEGRNTYAVFDQSIRDAMFRQLESEQSLRAALAERSLTVAFEPTIELRSGRVDSLLAVPQWPLPSGAVVSLDGFEQPIDDPLLLPSVERWLLEEALHARPRLTAGLGADVVVRIRTSAATLTPDFVADVQRLCDRHDTPPERLGFDVAESTVRSEHHDAHAALRELSHAGARVSLSRFGSGTAMFRSLDGTGVTHLRLAESLLPNSDQPTKAQRAAIAAVATLATELDLTVAADGVTHEAQLDGLMANGCVRAAGPLFHQLSDAGQIVDRARSAGR